MHSQPCQEASEITADPSKQNQFDKILRLCLSQSYDQVMYWIHKQVIQAALQTAAV